MTVRWREAGGGPGTGSTGESTYAKLERALREAYEAARGLRQGQQERRVELPELGDFIVKVYAKQREPEEYATILEVFKRGYPDPLCEAELSLHNGEPSAVDVDCGELEELASRCARGEGCRLSWEEARTALGLAGLAANVLAGLAGAPVKVEGTGLVEAYDIRDGEVYAFPCLQVSASGERRSMCKRVRLYRNPNRSWGVDGGLRLIPIGEAHARMAVALVELMEMVKEHIWNRKGEGAERTRARRYWGDFLKLEKIALHLLDGTEEVLLEPLFSELNYIGEDFAMVKCSYGCPKSGDGELAAMIKKELEEALGVVVRAVRRYMETGDPRYAALAYITVEALERAGLA